MNLRVRVFWALLLTIAAGIGTYLYLEDLRQEVGVVVATKAIPPRTVITAEMLQVRRISERARAEVLSLAFVDLNQVIGTVAVQEIPKGEVLRDDPRWVTRETQAAAAAGKQRLSFFLPEGTRAIAIVVDSQGLVAGRVKQGDLVDILFTSRDDSTGGVYSAVILQHVQVPGGRGNQRRCEHPVSGDPAGHARAGARCHAGQAPGYPRPRPDPPNPDTVDIPPASPLKFTKMGQTQ